MLIDKKIINIYKPPSRWLQISDFPVFPHPMIYAGDFNSPHTNWGLNADSAADKKCHAVWANSNNQGLLYNPKMHSASLTFAYFTDVL